MNELIILAHRGASGTCPENTLGAFSRALELGARWLELDTQLVEGELVVFHDDTLERTTNGVGRLSDSNLVDLRRLDAGNGEQVPLLKEVLSLAAGRAQVNIELKGVGTGAAVADLLQQLFQNRQLGPDDVLASSLRIKELQDFQRFRPEVRRAPIYETLPKDFGEQLKRFDAWSVHLHKSLISEELIRLTRVQKVQVFAWTVNDPEEAKRLKNIGTAGIFTDYPERFIRNG